MVGRYDAAQPRGGRPDNRPGEHRPPSSREEPGRDGAENRHDANKRDYRVGSSAAVGRKTAYRRGNPLAAPQAAPTKKPVAP